MTTSTPPALNFVTATDDRYLQTLAILLFGPPGTGKTVAAWSAPDPILYLNAEGPRGSRFARKVFGAGKQVDELLIGCRKDLEDAYMHARSTDRYETVVLDTLGSSYRVVLEEYAGGPGAKVSLPNHGDATTFLERYVRALMELPAHLVLLAHENIVNESGEAERYPLASTSSTTLSQKLGAAVDIVGYTGIVTGEDGGKRYLAQLVPGGGRHVKDRTDVLAGDQGVRDLNLQEWITAFREAYAPAASRKGDKQ